MSTLSISPLAIVALRNADKLRQRADRLDAFASKINRKKRGAAMQEWLQAHQWAWRPIYFEGDPEPKHCIPLHECDHALVTAAVRSGFVSLKQTGVLTDALTAARKQFPALPADATKEHTWKRSNDQVSAECMVKAIFQRVMWNNFVFGYGDIVAVAVPKFSVASYRIRVVDAEFRAVDESPEELATKLMMYHMHRSLFGTRIDPVVLKGDYVPAKDREDPAAFVTLS